MKASGAPVRSVVVLWGGNRSGSAERPSAPVVLGDTTVVFGLTALRQWVIALAGDTQVVSSTTAESVWQELDLVVSKREDRDQSAAPPASVDRAVWAVVTTTLAFTTTLLGCLETFAQTRSWWLFLTAVALLLCVCLLLRRMPTVRTAAAGGIVGLAIASTLAAVSAVVAVIT